MHNQAIKNKEKDLDNLIDYFKKEIGKIRTGRANPAMVENLLVDYYGAKTSLKQIASISAPEPRSLAIQPWDRGVLVNIEAAIRESQLGFNPVNDGQIIRIAIPVLTEERRKELVKVLNQEAEKARIAMRNIREEIWKEIQKMEERGAISEDDKFKGKEKLQEVIDGYNKKIEEIREKKEGEILMI